MDTHSGYAVAGRRVLARSHVAARGLLRAGTSVGGINKLLEWCYWFANDIGRTIRYGDQYKEYGITAYLGLFGAGKSISMVEKAWRVKRRLGDRVKVWSNVPVAFADGPLCAYQQILDCYKDGWNHLFLFDEIHLSWDQSEWKDVDPEFMTALTQQRKYGGGFAIYYTTQRLVQTATIWRRLAGTIVECSGWPTNRWVHQKAYAGIEEYNDGMPRKIGGSDDLRAVAWSYSFVADDFLRSQYRTDWVARRITRDSSVGVIGAEAVKAKMKSEAEGVARLLDARGRATAEAVSPRRRTAGASSR